MRIIALLPISFLLATFAPLGLHVPPQIPPHPDIRFGRVPLSADAPGQRRVGRLSYLGGWALRSADPRFGGISAMDVRDGTVLAVTDAGSVVHFALPGQDAPGRSAIHPIGRGPGPNARKHNRDAEAMAIANGKVWISFENRNAIWRYDAESWRAEASALPPAMAGWNKKSGGEAMVRLRDGRFLLFAEGQRLADGTTEALLFTRDPTQPGAKAVPLRYRAPDGYRVTEAAQLPDGRLIFLNRRVSLLKGFSAKLTLGTLPDLKAGTLLAGEEIAAFEPPVIAENLEALSAGQENGRTIVWIASDDNFSPLQRTLLLKFALED